MQNLGYIIIKLSLYFTIIFVFCDIILLLRKHLRDNKIYWNCVVINNDIVIRNNQFLQIFTKHNGNRGGYDKSFLKNFVGKKNIMFKVHDAGGNGRYKYYLVRELTSVEFY